MRVTVSMTYQRMLLNLNQKTEAAGRLADMIATGKRLSKPQDDPRAWSQAMDLKQGLRELNTFKKNLDFGIAWNETTVNALNSFSDLLNEAIETGISATNNSGDRETQIRIIEEISQQAVDLANTQYQGLYLFSGSSLSTAPFDDSLDYQGNTEDFEIRAGKNNNQVININGEAAFIQDSSDPDGSNILKQLAALKTALEAGDMTEVRNQTTALQNAREYLRARNSQAGLRLSYLDGQKSALDNLELNCENRLSDLEDADPAEAIILMQQNQTTLQAALQATSMLDDLSLVKFL